MFYRRFSEYMTCIEPNVRGCQQSKGRDRFDGYVATYTADPYNCSRPDTSKLKPTFRVPDQKLRYALPAHGALTFVNVTYDEALAVASAEDDDARRSDAAALSAMTTVLLTLLLLACI
jgi:hypothetical protein